MTAVEFLESRMALGIRGALVKVIEQAKEMEKQQIEDANERGFVVGRKNIGETAVDYYEKTFKTVIK